ncbi:hypothetical protein HBI64_006430 [Parastagonospora nodorum]|nr:hypothetical protein HBH51_037300 [Parastagonospora nodorum]KAH4608027.1 hypothetical protein HBH82_081890 [Parastagonospora nodorum]KAH4696758.1 hypothetical protein HBH78_069500 [Parastagonospora nodorum]KAH4709615.1 hypothetical protein HBH67_045870 [Parastagonospora nodorum]KAH4783053.1 hypothetical protein HBH62_111620 [Parastagonospora nodorum]
MVDQPDPPKSASDVKRERDVLNFHAAFRDIPHFEDLGPSPDTHSIPKHHAPKPATDASLAAFGQLAAMRLSAARSLISLIDDEYQYILAEATPKTSLKADSPLNKDDNLIFGHVRLPRRCVCLEQFHIGNDFANHSRWGICEKLLEPSALVEEGIIVINDFSKEGLYLNRSYVQEGRMRFYAGVPLVNKAGSVVGAVCVFDRDARDGLSQDDKTYLKDLAGVVMDYLETYTIRERYRRAAKGLHGLMSFAEGTASEPFSEQGQSLGVFAKDQVAATHEQRDQRLEYQELSGVTRIDSPETRREEPVSPTKESTDRRRSVSDLQDSLLPSTVKDLFARAAGIMRHSNDMSGVMFLDASYAASGSKDARPTSAGRRCKILGFATEEHNSLNGDVLPPDMIPRESNFKWVLEQYPQGYYLQCDELDDESYAANNSAPEPLHEFTGTLQQGQGFKEVDRDREQHTARVKALIPNIKTALFLPLWDFDRGRWFAGCFCWSTKLERALDGRLDLPFLKTFGHSIMQEVARLDASATSQSKTTFLSSLSHELRTPLHGILGSAHLMRNSRLDSFQVSMVNAITICGRTLLETVEHLLDHAERPEPNRKYSSTISHSEHSICITSEQLGPVRQHDESSDTFKCNVGFVTEEVVETMIVGETPYGVTIESHTDEESVGDQSTRVAIASKRSRFIILDITDYRALGFRLSASSYGRLVMNLVGNALKFTDNGYVHISVHSEDLSEKSGTVVVKVMDSGVGMRPRFLESAFEAFRKENQHTAGTGVGLSVVKRILEDVGGRIDISSEPSRGTEVMLKLPLQRLTEEEGNDPAINPLPIVMSGLEGRKVCILYEAGNPDDAPELVQHKRTVKRYVETLSATLSKVLKLDIHHSGTWDGTDDTEVVICPEVSFESLHNIRTNAAKSGRRCPATILIAMDVLEAETLRSDARVTSRESIVESITQPCGPYKLSVVLNACLHHYDHIDSPMIPSPSSANLSSGSWSAPQDSTREFGPRIGLYPSPTLALRRSKSKDPAAPDVQPPAPIQDEQRLHITQALIVDDNAINRRLLSAWMKKHGLPFREAKNGQQALDMYKDTSPPFDTVLMDISMPVMDGMTATRLIREFENEKGLQAAHVIALTGLTSASAKLEAWTSGVDDFLTKPVDFKRLEGLVRVGRGGEGTGFMKEHGSVP